MAKHEMQLGYTNLDDGIHLECSCGHDELVDKENGNEYWPSPAAVMRAANAHLAQHGLPAIEST
jgi:hypothetical protein